MTDFDLQLDQQLERAVAVRAETAAPAGAPSDRPRAELPAHPVLRYATGEYAGRYRRLMHVLYLENRNFGLRLKPEEVARRARGRFGMILDEATLTGALDQLEAWGALDRAHDASLASTTREYHRSRFTYDITPAGRRTEQFLAELDALGEQVGLLDGSRLPAIEGALNRLADLLAEDEADGTAVRSRFEQVLGEVAALHDGASDFMRNLNEVIAGSEQIDDAEFERCKGTLIDHLQGFRSARRRSAPALLAALQRVQRCGEQRLVDLIVDVEELPDLPGFSAAQTAARRRAELLERWHGVQAWFLGDEHAASPWRALDEKVIDAIRAVLDIAERIVAHRVDRANRASACEHLAGLVHAADPATGSALLIAALGIGAPRHVSMPEEDPELVPPGTSWWDAPPAPVTAHLRRPGARAPGAGRGTPIVDAAALRARVADRRRRERAELAAMLERFGRGREVRLSDLERIGQTEFRHLLAWIGRAYETGRDAAGARRAQSADGRAVILLRPPGDPDDRTTLVTPQGRFTGPNYRVEVRAG